MTASDAEAAKLPEGIVSLLCRVIEPGLAQHGDYDFVMGIPSSLSTIYFGNDFVKPRLSSRIVANVAASASFRGGRLSHALRAIGGRPMYQVGLLPASALSQARR